MTVAAFSFRDRRVDHRELCGVAVYLTAIFFVLRVSVAWRMACDVCTYYLFVVLQRRFVSTLGGRLRQKRRFT